MDLKAMQECMLEACRVHLRVWDSYEEGKEEVEEVLKRLSSNERRNFCMRLLLLELIPRMTRQRHRLSEYKEELPLYIPIAPGIVSEVLSERYDYVFGYYNKSLPYVFRRVAYGVPPRLKFPGPELMRETL